MFADITDLKPYLEEPGEHETCAVCDGVSVIDVRSTYEYLLKNRRPILRLDILRVDLDWLRELEHVTNAGIGRAGITAFLAEGCPSLSMATTAWRGGSSQAQQPRLSPTRCC